MMETEDPHNKRDSKKKMDDLPISTPTRIIIQSKDQSYTFDRSTYREEYLGRYINNKDYEDIITKASRIMGDSWTKKRKNDQIQLPRWIILLSVLSIFLVVIYMILLYLSPTSENGTAMLIGSIICVSAASLIIFSLSVYNFCRKIGTFKSLEEIMKYDLDEYFIKLNDKYQGNLEFRFNAKRRWIICNIKKAYEKGDKDEKRKFITEEVEEDPIKENEYEEDEIRRGSKKHSRGQSVITIPKVHSKNPSIIKNIMHSRQHSQKLNKGEEIELENFNY